MALERSAGEDGDQLEKTDRGSVATREDCKALVEQIETLQMLESFGVTPIHALPDRWLGVSRGDVHRARQHFRHISRSLYPWSVELEDSCQRF